MNAALSILVAVAVVGVIVFLFLRKRAIELPQEPAKPGRAPAAAPQKPGAVPAERAKASDGAAAAPTAPAPEQATHAPPPKDAGKQTGAAVVEQAPTATAEPPGPSTPRPGDSDTGSVEAMRKGLATTRGGFIARLAKLFGTRPTIDPSLLEEIEELLIAADVGVRTSDRMLDGLRKRLEAGQLPDERSVWEGLRSEAVAILETDAAPLRDKGKPAVILVVGVNGVGKTTTIGKLASRYVSEGKKVLLAAGDTFRAAAVLQLEMWGKRVGCSVVKGPENADPSSVVFDAIKRAVDEQVDVVIIDTAGRLHTKVPLMDEIKKVERTVAKANGRDADEVLLVLDSTTGQNAVQQMAMFREAVGVTGVVLTKLDGTAKGGVILGIVGQHRTPVRFIGLGERVEDLREFEAKAFVEALFARPDDETMAA